MWRASSVLFWARSWEEGMSELRMNYGRLLEAIPLRRVHVWMRLQTADKYMGQSPVVIQLRDVACLHAIRRCRTLFPLSTDCTCTSYTPPYASHLFLLPSPASFISYTPRSKVVFTCSIHPPHPAPLLPPKLHLPLIHLRLPPALPRRALNLRHQAIVMLRVARGLQHRLADGVLLRVAVLQQRVQRVDVRELCLGGDFLRGRGRGLGGGGGGFCGGCGAGGGVGWG